MATNFDLGVHQNVHQVSRPSAASLARLSLAGFDSPHSPRNGGGRTPLEPSHIRPVSRRPPASACVLSQFCATTIGSTRTLRPATLPPGALVEGTPEGPWCSRPWSVAP